MARNAPHFPSEHALNVWLAGQRPTAPLVAKPVRAPQPRVRPRIPASVSALEVFFQELQRVAQENGWVGCDTYNAHGPDSGLHCILVRECVLFIEVCTPVPPKHPRQQAWLDALRLAGQEVWEWGPMDRAAMRERLGRPVEKA